jgi:hypothetical protein
MQRGNLRIVFWLSFCLILLTACKLPGSGFVGKWQSARVSGASGAYIEITRIGVSKFKVHSWITGPLAASREDTYTVCGDALCVEDNLIVRSNRLRFLDKGNPNLLLNGEIGDETPNFWMKLAGQDTYKRVQ